jgi:uncharacterized protein with PIN domain
MKSEIYLRFYEELNDFLPLNKRKRCFAYLSEGNIRVEKLLQVFKVPPDLVEIVLVNGESVEFSHPLKNGDSVSIYPVFESLDVGPLVRVRKKPLRKNRFLVDASLSRLASYLRLFGFDTRISNTADGEDIIRAAEKGRRILLTRDAAFLRETSITRIHLVRYAKPRLQLTEILSRYDLYRSAAPYSRCPSCNKIIRNRRDWSCSRCGMKNRNKYRTERMQSFINRILSEGSTSQ